MNRRRRHVELPPRRIEQPTHIHTDTCQLSTMENGEVVVYRGAKAVTNWLNRVADLARERSGGNPTTASVGFSPVRAPAHLVRTDAPLAGAAPGSAPSRSPREARDDPARTPTPDRLGF